MSAHDEWMADYQARQRLASEILDEALGEDARYASLDEHDTTFALQDRPRSMFKVSSNPYGKAGGMRSSMQSEGDSERLGCMLQCTSGRSVCASSASGPFGGSALCFSASRRSSLFPTPFRITWKSSGGNAFICGRPIFGSASWSWANWSEEHIPASLPSLCH